jgi:hypothetical protein
MSKREFIEGIDYYLENGYVIFTEHYLKNRGYCCGNKCRHCPYELQKRGYTELKENKKNPD